MKKEKLHLLCKVLQRITLVCNCVPDGYYEHCSVFCEAGDAFKIRKDVGLKPSIHISFEGLGDELCYGTLLSKKDSIGPSSAWDEIDAHAQQGMYDKRIMVLR